jgi:hypothetical protein
MFLPGALHPPRAQPLLKLMDRSLLCNQCGYDDAFERYRTRCVCAACQLHPRRTEDLVKGLLVFFPQSSPELRPAFHLLLDDLCECWYCSAHTGSSSRENAHRRGGGNIVGHGYPFYRLQEQYCSQQHQAGIHTSTLPPRAHYSISILLLWFVDDLQSFVALCHRKHPVHCRCNFRKQRIAFC